MQNNNLSKRWTEVYMAGIAWGIWTVVGQLPRAAESFNPESLIYLVSAIAGVIIAMAMKVFFTAMFFMALVRAIEASRKARSAKSGEIGDEE